MAVLGALRRRIRKGSLEVLETTAFLQPLARWHRRRWLHRIGAPDPDALMRRWFRRPPGRGQLAPDFTLARRDGSGAVTLSEVLRRKPVVLVFGSFT